MDQRTGLLLVGHGTDDAAGIAEFKELTAKMSALRPDAIVVACVLELARPTIGEGLDRLVERGISEVVVIPAILLAAGHVKRDIPRLVAEAAARHPKLVIRLAPHLGYHPKLVELSAQRFHEAANEAGGGRPEAVGNVGPNPKSQIPNPILNPKSQIPNPTLCLLVGRGSRDPDSQLELQEFARLRQPFLGGVEQRICYLAMAEPTLAEGFEAAADSLARQIVVQPHLLFRGVLLSRLTEEFAKAASRWPEKDWRLGIHLGPDAGVGFGI